MMMRRRRPVSKRNQQIVKTRRTKNVTRDHIIDQIDKDANTDRKKNITIHDDILCTSGSTMLNLACSDRIKGAYGQGRIITLPGGSSSGKTILMLTMLAYMVNDSHYDDFVFIYDDGEEALAFDIEYLFGTDIVDAIEPPGGYDEDGNPINSNTIQDFKNHILRLCKGDKPFIYVLDSLDSLSSSQEVEKEFKAAMKAAKSKEEKDDAKGSYKTEKAKMIGETIRIINGHLKKTKSLLFIIQQERQKIGAVFGKKKTTSGGEAPFFYSSHQIWLTKIKAIKNDGVKIGHITQAEVTKNKLTGKLRTVSFNIYYDYGLDDIESCLSFLLDRKWFKVVKQTIYAEEFDFTGTKSKLIDHIEKNKLENILQKLCQEAWVDREENVRLNRTKNFKV